MSSFPWPNVIPHSLAKDFSNSSALNTGSLKSTNPIKFEAFSILSSPSSSEAAIRFQYSFKKPNNSFASSISVFTSYFFISLKTPESLEIARSQGDISDFLYLKILQTIPSSSVNSFVNSIFLGLQPNSFGCISHSTTCILSDT